RRTTPMPPRPGGVAMATMVSSRFMVLTHPERPRGIPIDHDKVDVCSMTRFWILCRPQKPLQQPKTGARRPSQMAFLGILHARFGYRAPSPASRDRDVIKSILLPLMILQPRPMLFQPFVEIVELAVELGHFQLGLQIYLVILIGLQAVFRCLA